MYRTKRAITVNTVLFFKKRAAVSIYEWQEFLLLALVACFSAAIYSVHKDEV